MGIFHVSLRSFSRALGRSATAAAAYRVGTRVADDRTGLTFDYSRRKGVQHVSTFVPAGAPAWARDLARLWNAAEAAEVRCNARTARELLVGLSAELSTPQHIALTADLARLLVDRYGVAATAALHAPDARGDQRNVHAHILFTTRALTPQGLGAKCRVLDDLKTGPLETEAIRAAVAGIINGHLARAGLSDRVDHRTLKAQALAAEARGDLAAAVLLTREPKQREARTVVEDRRRGIAVGPNWNDEMAASNRVLLLDYLHKAEAEGRLVQAPVESREQARADRTRETAATHPTLALPSAPLAPRVRGGSRAGAMPSARVRLSSASTRTARAHGAGADILNAQAEGTAALRRAQAEALQAWLDALHTLARELGEQSQRQVEAYARRVSWSTSTVVAQADRCARGAAYRTMVRESIRAHERLEQAETRIERRRNAYGAAMVATVEEQNKLERIEAERKPNAWQPLSRREWAERRRQQQIRLASVKAVERRVAQAVSEHVLAECAAEEAAARDAFKKVERQRRKAGCRPRDINRQPRRAYRSGKTMSAASPASNPLDAETTARTRRAHRPPGRSPRM